MKRLIKYVGLIIRMRKLRKTKGREMLRGEKGGEARRLGGEVMESWKKRMKKD